ncbi:MULTISPECIES: hypothetical protein [unclassified Novosphingobium]|uniref:hypothetical protein n=1 Tax=unclassified Novosphingobium TaxID=2644732 RepID=UPI00135C709A|nr:MULTISPECIES: hypothetical protein [unclassified Novosphingobium]
MITRRQMIGAMGAASAIAVPGFAAAVGLQRPPFRAVCDLKLAGGRALQDAALSAGCDVLDPQGEIVQLFHGPAASWLGGDVPVIGYTRWSDFHMMSELARAKAGTRITQAAMVSKTGPCRELVLPQNDRLTARMRSLLNAVSSACSNGGIVWIIQS